MRGISRSRGIALATAYAVLLLGGVSSTAGFAVVGAAADDGAQAAASAVDETAEAGTTGDAPGPDTADAEPAAPEDDEAPTPDADEPAAPEDEAPAPDADAPVPDAPDEEAPAPGTGGVAADDDAPVDETPPAEEPSPSAPDEAVTNEEPPSDGDRGPTADALVAEALALEPGCTTWSNQMPGGFETDGNLCDNFVGLDWATAGTTADDAYGAADTSAFTQGSKENNWPWSAAQTGATGMSPSSNDVGAVHAYSATVGGDVYAFLGFERDTSNGSIAYHVELNALANSFGPVSNRSDGDLRLTLSQTGQTTIALVGAEVWDAGASAWVSLGSTAGFAGAVNGGDTANLADETLERGTFSEVAVNLTDLFGEAGCSGSYGTLNIRSSASPEDTSQLKDWVRPISLSVPSTCASVQVDKTWVIDGETYADGEQPFGATAPTLTGRASAVFGEAYATDDDGDAYEAGGVVAVGETAVTGLPIGCSDEASGDLGEHTLTAGLNVFAITNTVTCTYLTVEKAVSGGDAAPGDWTLSATGPTPISGSHGDAAVTRAHVEPGAYAIGESDGPDGYRQTALSCSPTAVSGGTVAVAAGDDVTCIITNTAEVGLKVTKTWMVDGEEYPDGEQPVGTAELAIDGETAAFGATYDGFLPGDEVSISETVSDLPARCEATTTIDGADGRSATHTMTADPDPNVVAVVNTVDCAQRLTLVKEVGFGDASPQEWTLTATGPDDDTTFSGTPDDDGAVVAEVPPNTPFALSESGGPAEYVQDGDWACTDDDTGETVDSTGAAVTAGYGQAITCTVTNVTATLTLLKHIGGDDAGVLDPADWTLSAMPGCDVDGLATIEATGAEEASDANTAEVRPGCDYALDESAAEGSTLGYRQVSLERWDADAGEWVAVDSATITVAPATHDTYRFVNDVAPAAVLPLTGGASTDAFTLVGALTLLAAAILAGWHLIARRRRKAA